MTPLERAVLNTGKKTYAEIQEALYEQGVDVSESGVRQVMRRLRLTTSQPRR